MTNISTFLNSLRSPAVHVALGVILALIAALGILPNSSSTSSTSRPGEQLTTPTSTVEPAPTSEPEPTAEPEPETEVSLPSIDNREDILAAGISQRGGQIGTGGKPAVALRFDHHLEDFETKVLPLLQKYNLPWGADD